MGYTQSSKDGMNTREMENTMTIIMYSMYFGLSQMMVGSEYTTIA